jgi:hypothetical protein
MASAWGLSFGSSWGDAWGSVAISGGGGGTRKKKTRKKLHLPEELITLAPGSVSPPVLPIHEPDEDDEILLIALQRILH